MNTSFKSLINALGPGILLAGAAVGVSHLVQATRAGADYGFSLWWLLLLAIITKYPFLEIGPRYAASRKQSLIAGYKGMGYSYFVTYLLLTILTMFAIQAAVTIVTAGLAEYVFGFGWSPFVWSLLILSLCACILLIGNYPALDFTMKFIISLLVFLTVVAVVLALGAFEPTNTKSPASYWNAAGVAFIIAFMGWMPIPLDASVWHSIWTGERARQKNTQPDRRLARVDFDLGYAAAGLIGIMFFLLGALVMYGSGLRFPVESVAFSAQIVDMYASTVGSWSAAIIATAALITMFSTTLAVADAYPRVLMESFRVAKQDQDRHQNPYFGNLRPENIYKFSVVIIPVVSLLILFRFNDGFTVLVDLAASLSFLAAPLLAWFNLRLITTGSEDARLKPSGWYLLFCYACLLLLIVFSLIWLYWRFL